MSRLCAGPLSACIGRGALALLLGCSPAFAGETGRGDRTTICVLVPHFKDEYWLSVAYGLEQAAAARQADLMMFEAGGYRSLDRQIGQLRACARSGSDVVLIGAVSSDDPGLLAAIAEAGAEVPVIALVNELNSEALSGSVGVDWREMGASVGRYLADRHPPGTAAQRALLVSGPEEAGWTGPLELGLRRELRGSAIDLVEVLGGDTGMRQQLALVEAGLERHPDVDYVIGSAPAIEAAMGLLRFPDHVGPPKLVATYVSHSVRRGLTSGSVLAVAYDSPRLQGEIALRQALRLAGKGGVTPHAGPEIRLVTQSGSDTISLSPADYFPEIR